MTSWAILTVRAHPLQKIRRGRHGDQGSDQQSRLRGKLLRLHRVYNLYDSARVLVTLYDKSDFAITFVIQGKEFAIIVMPDEIIKNAVKKAQEKSGNKDKPDDLKVRTEEGKILDQNKSFSDQGITNPTKLFLDKGPGRGGRR